jgi:uncharacterized SAM-binding protein YcdF (DUF218 family)
LALLKSRTFRWALPASFALLAALAYPIWLRLLGSYLVRGQEPFRAGIVVVLAGDDRGNRILKAAELVKRGYAPQILVSAPYCCYGHIESDMAIPFAVSHGYPAAWFVPFPVQATSTAEEARAVISELDRRHIDRFLVVTSDYHTRRAAHIYGKLVDASRFRVVSARDWAFHPDDWWRNREGRKQAFYEWTKTIANWSGGL